MICLEIILFSKRRRAGSHVWSKWRNTGWLGEHCLDFNDEKLLEAQQFRIKPAKLSCVLSHAWRIQQSEYEASEVAELKVILQW